jgi:hypothetical protein
MNQLIKLLILSLFFLFPFGQLTRLPWFGPEVNIYLHDLIIGLVLILWLVKKKFSFSKKDWPILTQPILQFALLAFISLVWASPHYSFRQVIISSLYLLRWLSYAGLYFVLSDKNNRFLSRSNLVSGLIFSSSLLAGFGLIQYFFLPDTRFLKYSGWDDHYFRLISTLIDPAFTGIILVLGLVLISLTRRRQKSFYPLFGLHFISLLLTYSRSSYLALFTAGLVLAWQKHRLKPFLVLFCLALVLMLSLPRPGGEGVKLERLYSVNQRLENWGEAWTIIKQHPSLGIGFNALRYYRENLSPTSGDWQTSHAASGFDSSLLFVFVTTGLFGLVFYLSLLSQTWFFYPHPVKLSLAALLAHSLFNNSLFYSWVMLWFWILLAAESKESN